MDTLAIVTNNRRRAVVRWFQLTDAERKEFDYIDTEQRQDEAEFVRYRRWTYDLHDMERLGGSAMPDSLAKWDNYRTDSFFSGIVIRWVDDGERVICGTFYTMSG